MQPLLVVPVIHPTLAYQCLDSLRWPKDHVLVVDNGDTRIDTMGFPTVRPGRNIGVAGAWNVGAVSVMQDGFDMLVICSQAIVFGPAGGQDLLAQLSATDGWGLNVAGAGWHLIGITRATLAAVGPFDEGFWPGYYEDTDYLYRMGLAGLPSPRENGRAWPTVACGYADAGHGLMIKQTRPDFPMLGARYAAKWGGAQGSEMHRTPWGLDQPTWWWPDSPYPNDNPWRTHA